MVYSSEVVDERAYIAPDDTVSTLLYRPMSAARDK